MNGSGQCWYFCFGAFWWLYILFLNKDKTLNNVNWMTDVMPQRTTGQFDTHRHISWGWSSEVEMRGMKEETSSFCPTGFRNMSSQQDFSQQPPHGCRTLCWFSPEKVPLGHLNRWEHNSFNTFTQLNKSQSANWPATNQISKIRMEKFKTKNFQTKRFLT